MTATTGIYGSADGRFADILIGGASVLSGDVTLDVSNTLVLAQTLPSPVYRNTSNAIGFAGIATSNFLYESVSNTFSFTSEAGPDAEINITQYLGFTDRFIAPPLGNFIGFVDVVAREYTAAADNTFSWNNHDTGEALKRTYNAENTLILSNIATAIREEDCRNDFTPLSVTVDAAATNYGRPVTHSVIKQHLTYSISGGPTCVEKEYTPFIGSSGDTSYGTVSETPPTLGAGTLTLTYPSVSPTTTLVIKNPTFGNTDTFTFTVIDRETRGGDRVIFSDPTWSRNQVLALTIENICEPEIDDLIDFLNESLGQEIGLLDWENRQWAGVILGPDTEITKTQGGYQVGLTFEGDLV